MMQIFIDETPIMTLTPEQILVFERFIPSAQVPSFIENVLKKSIENNYEMYWKRICLEWHPKLLANAITEMPIDRDDCMALIVTQPDYKDADALIAEAEGE